MDPGPPHKRRRPAIACTECRRRKTSCDLGSPCGPCRKSRSNLRCVYNNNNNNNNNTGNSNSGDDYTGYGGGRTRTGSDKKGGSGDSNLGSGDNNFGGSGSRLDISESEIVRSSVSDSDPSSNHQLPGAALFGDSVQESEFRDEEMLDLSFLTGSTCFDIEPANALSSAEGTEGSLWDTGSRLGFPPIFPYSRQSDSMSDLERYLRLPVTASPPRMAVDTTSTVTTPWNNVTVRCDGVRYLLRKYAGGRSDGDESAALCAVSDAETGRPLMEMLTKLERAARAAHEAKADVALGAWPDPTTVGVTAATAKKLLPPRPQCDVLVRAYIKTFESLLRVLDVPSFLLQYDRFWEPPTAQPTSADQISICHILLVITLGSCVTLSPLATADSQSALQQETAARISFARHWLTRQMVWGYRASLGVAQSMCLLALTGMIRPQPSSALTGADFLLGDYDLTRIGFQIGLHRAPTTRNPGMSAKEVEMRRGLWTTMLELSLQRCFEKGLPAPLMPESYDCEPPSGTTGDDEEALWPGLSPVVKPSIPQMLAKTQRLRLQILGLLNAPKTPKAYEESHQLAAELNEACKANLAILQEMTPTPAGEFQIHMMELFTRPFVLALHSPFANQATVTKPMNYYSRMMRMELSAQLLARPFGLKSVLQDSNSGESSSSSSSFASSSSLSLLDFAAKAQASQPDASSAGTMHAVGSGGTYGGGTQSQPGTGVPPGALIAGGDTGGEGATPDAYASLLLHGHGPYAHSKRQVAAALALDLITELEENPFPTILGPIRQLLRDVLLDVVRIFERRVIGAAGAHSTHEFVLFSAAAAYVDGLLFRGTRGKTVDGGRGHLMPDLDVDEAVSSAAARALTLCAEVVGRKNPELAHGL